MIIVSLSLKDANRFVANFHRHSKKVTNELVGVAIAGRPVARLLDNGRTIEILRVCVKNGVKNANSKLYARMKRICQLMGYGKIITYTLQHESGSSLKAIGARSVAEVKHRAWCRPKRRRGNQKIYSEEKVRWEL